MRGKRTGVSRKERHRFTDIVDYCNHGSCDACERIRDCKQFQKEHSGRIPWGYKGGYKENHLGKNEQK